MCVIKCVRVRVTLAGLEACVSLGHHQRLGHDALMFASAGMCGRLSSESYARHKALPQQSVCRHRTLILFEFEPELGHRRLHLDRHAESFGVGS